MMRADTHHGGKTSLCITKKPTFRLTSILTLFLCKSSGLRLDSALFCADYFLAKLPDAFIFKFINLHFVDYV
ncbi:hypothetical protein A9P82_05695 [Arachidicoccus ginsenosidimutans]|nr:hypothetical protein A9P82_05695 [Arachidicoccus sp. BS20]